MADANGADGCVATYTTIHDVFDQDPKFTNTIATSLSQSHHSSII
jgi:hypothetical protein